MKSLHKIGSSAARLLGIEPDERHQQIPTNLAGRATEAISPLDPYFEQEPTVNEWIRDQIPSRHDILPYILSFFPFTTWIGRYNARWLLGDVIAGITLGLVVIPQAMAYALLANLNPEYGLYTSFTGASLYWLFGTSKDIAIGATAVVSLLVGKTGSHVQDKHPQFTLEEIAKTHAFLAGCILLLFGLLRLDWIIEFIPHVAISAFVTGAALTISLSQLPSLLGIVGINSKGPAYEVFIDTVKGLGRTKLDAAVGLTALLLLSVIKWFCELMATRQPKKAKTWGIINSLRLTFTILLYTFISFLVHRNIPYEESKFKILGPLPTGFGSTGAPSFDTELMTALIPELPATVIILIIEHIAIGKSFGRINNYIVIPSQELMSIGFTNLLGPFIGAYASTGSFGGTAILSKAGARTPLAGIFNGGILLLALYVLTRILFFIPMASLAALIIHAVINLITPPSHIHQSWLVSPPDVFIHFTGVFVSIFTSLENGIYATVVLSAALLLLRLARSPGRFLGRVQIYRHPRQTVTGQWSESSSTTTRVFSGRSEIPSRDIFLPLGRNESSNPNIYVEPLDPGVFIFRFTDGFNYLNQAQHMDCLTKHIMSKTRPTSVKEYAHPGDRPWNESTPILGARDSDTEDSLSHNDLPTLRAIVFDCSSINNLDTGAVEGLIDLRNQFDRWAAPEPVEWHFACVKNQWTRRALAVAGFGYPSKLWFETRGDKWTPIFSVAEVQGDRSPRTRERSPWSGLATPVSDNNADENVVGRDDKVLIETMVKRRPQQEREDEELGNSDVPSQATNYPISQGRNWDGNKGVNPSVYTTPIRTPDGLRLAAVQGIDRPNFHVDLKAAVECALKNVEDKERYTH